MPEMLGCTSNAEMVRPLVDDWARDYGLKVKFVHEWRDIDGRSCVTAFAYDEAKEAMTLTVVQPKAQ